ncbi:MAG TPA: glutaminyl-peptide cyclotransferase [Euzebya sp.]|nr:glutaminyl-peptide cyclotransferase [Euzebya sp.]
MQLTPRLSPLIAALAVLIVACGQAADTVGVSTVTAGGQPPEATATPSVQAEASPSASIPTGDVLAVREVARRPHDATAFTQGLEFDDSRLFESRGLRPDQESVTLTEIDPADGSALRELARDGDHFAEGLTVVDGRIIQLTWQSGVANVYDRDTFEPLEQFTYEGEGWGICDEPDRLIMSDGTSTLTFRDRDTFAVLGTVEVDLDGQPNDDLNELECVDGLVWANLWNTNIILVIDPDTGSVVSEVDVSSLADSSGRLRDGGGGDVLNGIAHDPSSDTWLLTGKWWPWMFEVTFDCVEGCEADVTPSHYVRPRPPGVTSAVTPVRRLTR